MSNTPAAPAVVDDPAVTFAQFLESTAPGRTVRLTSDGFERKWASGSGGVGSGSWYVAAVPPFVTLYCGYKACERGQGFAPSQSEREFVVHSPERDQFLTYRCRNCGRWVKTFALRFFNKDDDIATISALKFGERPPFGPPLPAKMLQLAGDYGDLLKKGRQSENQSLGIGAFAYYRRVVELQKGRLIDELKAAVQRIDDSNATALDALEAARKETQFSKALELMADVTPKELFISGQNPLRLLHGPLSVGLHTLTDEECLTKAHSVRLVLSALLDRVQMVTQSQAELDAAIKDLLP